MLTSTQRRLIPSAFAAAVLAFMCAQRHSGFFLYLFVLVWLVWLPYSAYVIVRKPQLRRLQVCRVVLWLSTALLITCIHLVRHNVTREAADEIVANILSYAVAHGEYPPSMAELGLSKDLMKAKFSLGFYSRDEAGTPHFIYAVTFEPFSTFSYDFEKRLWMYQPD